MVSQDDPYRDDIVAAERYADRGKSSRARSLYEEILDDADEFGIGGEGPSAEIVSAAKLGLVELDYRSGSYDEVEAQIGELEDAQRQSVPVRWLESKLAARLGRYGQRVEILRSLVDRRPDELRMRYALGDALYEVGKREEARALWDNVVEASQRDSVRDPDALYWVARAHVALGSRSDLERASALIADALKNGGDTVGPKILYGWIQFLAYGEASGFPSGEKIIDQDVLRNHGDVERALITLYEIRKENFALDAGKTVGLLDRALGVNSNCVDAMRYQAIRMLDDRRFESGADRLDDALDVNPNDKRVLAQRAAAAMIMGESGAAAEYRKRALAVDPKCGVALDIALGDRLAALYRFADSMAPYERALEVDPASIPALHGLAKSAVYTGQGERARTLLQRAAELQNGLVNPWRNNILASEELLAEEYERIETEGFVFRIHREDAAILEEYLVPFHQAARRDLGAKYGVIPDRPTTVEVMHTWDDFSVRTIGFRGFTALGACFGNLVTLVSPVDGDLRQNDFMWTATVWHEYTHVLTLALSKARVPRWLTEGLSVYEEKQKDETWERGMQRELLDAYHNGQIPPVHLLNRLFRGPRILFGYYQGGLIVELLAREHGFDKVLEMLGLYGEDLPQSKIFEQAFGMSTREFDAAFLEFVRSEKLKGLRIIPRWDNRAVDRMYDKLARGSGDVETHIKLAWAMLGRGVEVDAADQLRQILAADPESAEGALIQAELLLRKGLAEESDAAFERGFRGKADNFDSRIRYGQSLQARGDLDGAARQYLAAKRCWPKCTDQKVSPSVLLARIYREQDKRVEAMMELKAFCRLTARAFDPRIRLAAWEREVGNREAEAELLEEALQIDPFSRSVHLALADALRELGDETGAIRELRVALAVDPSFDRDHAGQEGAPTSDDPAFKESQAQVCVQLARLHRKRGDADRSVEYLERALEEAPGSDAAGEAKELLGSWRK